MEYRKLISFGKGGFVLSMPKTWVMENNLGKGSLILIERKGKSLLVSARTAFGELETKGDILTIEIGSKPKDLVKRLILGAYIDNRGTIIVRGSELVGMHDEISAIVNHLVALEIIESARDRLVIKDYLDFSSVKIPKIIRKIDLVLRVMFTCIQEGEFSELKEQELEVNKYYFLMLKALSKASKEPAILKLVDVEFSSLLNFWRQSHEFERIGDTLIEIGAILRKRKFDDKMKPIIMSLFKRVETHYLETMKIHFRADGNAAYLFSSKRHNLEKEFVKAYEEYFDVKYFSPLLGKFREILQYNQAILRSIMIT